MKSLKGRFDFDGVIVNSHILRVPIAHEMFGVEPQDPIFYVNKHLDRLGLTQDQLQAVKVEVYDGPREPEVVSGAHWGIHELLRDGHDLGVVTARKAAHHFTRAEKLLVQENIPLACVGVGYRVSKKDACAGLDFYIDDDLGNLTDLLGSVPHLFYYVWPWNEDVALPAEVIAVRSWEEFVDHIRRIASA